MAQQILKHPATRIILVLAVIVVVIGFATDWTFGFKKKGSKAGDDCTTKDNSKGKIDANGNCIAVEGGPGQPGGGQSTNPQGGSRYAMSGACGDKAGQPCGTNCWYVNDGNDCVCKCDKPSQIRTPNVIPVNNVAVSTCSGNDCSGLAGLPSGSCYQVNVNGQCRCHCFNSRASIDCSKVTCLPNGLTTSGTASACCNPYLL